MKKFKVQDILTITTGRLLTQNILAVYELVDYMTDDIHELGYRAKHVCAPVLEDLYPELAEVDLDVLDTLLATHGSTYETIEIWLELEAIRLKLKDEYGVPKVDSMKEALR